VAGGEEVADHLAGAGDAAIDGVKDGVPDEREGGELAESVNEGVAALDVGELVGDGGALLWERVVAEVVRQQEGWAEDADDDRAGELGRTAEGWESDVEGVGELVPQGLVGFGEGVGVGGGEELVGCEVSAGKADEGTEDDDGVEGREEVDGAAAEAEMEGREDAAGCECGCGGDVLSWGEGWRCGEGWLGLRLMDGLRQGSKGWSGGRDEGLCGGMLRGGWECGGGVQAVRGKQDADGEDGEPEAVLAARAEAAGATEEPGGGGDERDLPEGVEGVFEEKLGVQVRPPVRVR
jgi:hypothetical protein